MATSAISQLEAQIETIRREAYQQGYAAAMQAVTDFATGIAKSKTVAPTSRRPREASPTPTSRRPQSKGPTTRRRMSRGDNARHVAEALRGLPDHTGTAAAIRKALASNGVSLAYTSIRHALGQLQTRGDVTAGEDGKTWTYTASA